MEDYFGHRTTHFPGKRCSPTCRGGIATAFRGLVGWTRARSRWGLHTSSQGVSTFVKQSEDCTCRLVAIGIVHAKIACNNMCKVTAGLGRRSCTAVFKSNRDVQENNGNLEQSFQMHWMTFQCTRRHARQVSCAAPEPDRRHGLLDDPEDVDAELGGGG
jgi:hypothetical protein